MTCFLATRRCPDDGRPSATRNWAPFLLHSVTIVSVVGLSAAQLNAVTTPAQRSLNQCTVETGASTTQESAAHSLLFDSPAAERKR